MEGDRGVEGLLEIRTRCLGVIVTFSANASWCRGVDGVARRLCFTVDCFAGLLTEKWALILLVEGVTCWEGVRFEGRVSGLSCILGEELGLKNGLSFSSFPRTNVSRRFARVWTEVLSSASYLVSLEEGASHRDWWCVLFVELRVRLPRTEGDIDKWYARNMRRSMGRCKSKMQDTISIGRCNNSREGRRDPRVVVVA